MSYDSRYTDGSGDLGKGWMHNYEQKLVNENGSARYYMDNNKSLNFVSDAVLNGNLIGTYDEETKVITLDDLAGEEITHSCTNAGMDSWKLTRKTDGNVITYIYGDGLIAKESGQDYVTYHYNQIGSTTALTDKQGSVVETYEYSPYGDILDGDSSLTMFLYNGKYGVASDDNGLYYMRARYYDISIKRFVNQDVVIGHLDATSSLNRYAYCEGNPVSYLDSFGLDRFCDYWDLDLAHYIATWITYAAYGFVVAASALSGGTATLEALGVALIISEAVGCVKD